MWKNNAKIDADTLKPTMNTLEAIESMPTDKPRFIKTHLHYSLLPYQVEEKKAKIIYVARNSKDACISYYHHSVGLDGYKGSLEDFTESFISDNCKYF